MKSQEPSIDFYILWELQEKLISSNPSITLQNHILFFSKSKYSTALFSVHLLQLFPCIHHENLVLFFPFRSLLCIIFLNVRRRKLWKLWESIFFAVDWERVGAEEKGSTEASVPSSWQYSSKCVQWYYVSTWTHSLIFVLGYLLIISSEVLQRLLR